MTLSERRQVVVTGSGALCPAGIGAEALLQWRRQPGAATHVPDFRPADYIRNARQLRTMQRLFQLAASAAMLALRDAGLITEEALSQQSVVPERAGTAVAVGDISPVTADLLQVLREVPLRDGKPDWARFAEAGGHQLHPFRRLTLLPNMAAAHVSLLLGLCGPSCTFTSGARAGEQAITEACWMIADGHADFMVVEAADTPDYAFTAQPVKEAAGALLLEARSLAEQRGAAILAVCEQADASSDDAASHAEAGPPWPAAPVAGSLLDAVAWVEQVRRGEIAADFHLPGLRLQAADAAHGGEA